ncbi:MAG TPA: AI-2E family transporter [Burkholderiaceae bacterium]|jgi:predicted PurR-regulated permease PerM
MSDIKAFAPRPRADPVAAPSPRPARTPRGPITGMLALAAVLLLKLTAALTLPLLCALLLFMLASPAMEALQRRGVAGWLAASALVFAPASAALVLGAGMAPAGVAWWRATLAALARLANQLAATPGASAGPIRGGDWLASRLASAEAQLRTATDAWFAGEALPVALRAVTVLMLVFFLLLAQRSLLASLLRALPRRRTRVRCVAMLRDIRTGIAGCVATTALVNLGLALCTGAALAAIGRAGVGAWIGVVFVLLFIPYLGPLMIIVLLAVTGGSSGLGALLAPAIFLLLHAIEAQFVSPFVLGGRLRLGRPALLVAVLVAGSIWGGAGAVLAVPLLVVTRAVCRRGRGTSVALALMAGERPLAQTLESVAAAAIVAAPRERGMPWSVTCESPSSPRPIRPRSTAWRSPSREP